MTQITPICFTVNEFLSWSRISRATFYREVAAGNIVVRKLGKRSLIDREEAERWFNALPERSPVTPAAT